MEKKIIEGNKLISEFMGIIVEVKAERLYTSKHFGIKMVQYHSSWDWLMPVVEKISDYHYPDFYIGEKPEEAHEFDDYAYPRTFGMRDEEGNYMVRINANSLHKSQSFIEATWLAIVDWIDWYNTNQSK